MDKKVSIIIPCMNESETIGQVIDSLKKELTDYDPEIIVVDKSADDSAEIAKKHGAIVLNQEKSGYGAAIIQGFTFATGRVLVMMDADGTYLAKDVKSLVSPILENKADFVIGDRFPFMSSGAMSNLNKLGNKMLTALANILFGTNVRDTQCGARAISKKAFNAMSFYEKHMPFATEMVFKAKINGLRIAQIPINYNVRVGKTKLSPLKDGAKILIASIRMIRDHNPLLTFGLPGIIMLTFGAYFAVETMNYFNKTGIVIIGRSSLALFFSLAGIICVMIGLIIDSIKTYLSEN